MLNTCLHIYNKLFVVWVVLGGLAAFFFPQIFLPLKQYMELFFALTMFGIGMVLDVKEFKHIFKHFWIVLIGVCAQFTIMPFLSFLVGKVLCLSPELALGLILTGAAPGAMASNVLSYLAKADVAYSVSLTTVSTLLAPVLTPLLTLWLAHTIFEIPFLDMLLSVVNMVIVPLFIGFTVKHFFTEKANKAATIFPAISTTFIVFICSLVIALNRTYLLTLDYLIFIAVLLLNIGGMISGYLVGKISRFDLQKKRALAIEIGMQNAGLGSVLALKHFNEKVALPAAIFVFICIFTAAFLAQLWSRQAEVRPT